MDDDFELWRLSDYALNNDIYKDLKLGEYDRIISNKPAVLANDVIETLSDSKIFFTYPIDTEKSRDEKEKLSITERFVYGCFNAADMQLLAYGLPGVQSLLAWHATLRGWIGIRALFVGDKNDIRPDIAVWDMRNVAYGYGKNGLAWATYRKITTKEQAEDEYGQTFEDDGQGRVSIYDNWNDETETVVVDNKVVHKLEHGIGRIPVHIGAVGSTPPIQSDVNDTLVTQGESIFANNRTTYPSINRMLSYYMTTVGIGTRTPTVVYYEGDKPPDMPDNPYVKGNTIFLRKDKQEVKEFFKPTMPDDAARMLSTLMGFESQGGIAPIALGEINQALPAAGINILTNSALKKITPRKRTIERAMQWAAMELIRQYKNGHYGDMTLQGTDSLNYDFTIKAKPSDLIDDRIIHCSVNPKMPQDELQNAGIAAQLASGPNPVLSRQTVQDKYLNILDTDAEMARIRVEQGEADEFVRNLMTAKDMIDAKEYGAAEAFTMKAMISIGQVRQQAQQMMQSRQMPPVAGVPRGALPTGGIPGNPQADTERMQRIGLVRGQ